MAPWGAVFFSFNESLFISTTAEIGRSNFDVGLDNERDLRPEVVIDVLAVTDGHVGDVEAGLVRCGPAGSPDHTPQRS